MRVVAETTAAVLVTLAFASVVRRSGGGRCSLAALIMTARLVRARRVEPAQRRPRARARRCCASRRRSSARVRVLLGPIADALVALGNRVTPGRPRTATLLVARSSCSAWSTRHRARRARGGRPRAHPLDLRVQRHRRARGDDPAHRHGHDRRRRAPSARRWGCSSSTGVSRMPVIGDDVDEVLGILYLRDVARLELRAAARLRERSRSRELARPALFVPESKKADDTAAPDAARVEPPRHGRRRVRRHRRAGHARGPHRGARRRHLRRVRPRGRRGRRARRRALPGQRAAARSTSSATCSASSSTTTTSTRSADCSPRRSAGCRVAGLGARRSRA